MTARARRSGRVFMQEAERMPQGDDFHQRIRALEALPAGLGIFEIKVFEDDATVIIRDWKFDIPSDLDGAQLVDVEAWVTAPSSSGTITVQFRNETQGQDMLSTVASIDVGELNDDDSGTPFVIDTANAEVAYKDEIWVRVLSSGTDALGLGVKVAFTPASTAAIVLDGAQGPAGGITSFQGDWTTSTTYVAGDVVIHNGTVYVVVVDHTSDGTTEPGVGVDWENFLVEFQDLQLGASINVVTLGGSYILTDGIKSAVWMPFSGTITQAVLLADIAGNAEVDIWKSDYAGYPPTVADSIVGAFPPTLSTQIKNLDSTLTGWDTTFADGDILVFYVSGVTLISRLTIVLLVDKD